MSVIGLRTKLHLYNSIVKSVDWSAGKLLKWIYIRLRHFTMDAYTRSVGFSGPGQSQLFLDFHAKFEIALTNSEPIQATIKQSRLRWVGHILRMSHERIPRVPLR